MSRIVVNAPLNGLSFGNVSYNLLREFYEMGQEILLLPHSSFDLSSFDKIQDGFKKWLAESARDNISRLSKDDVSLKLWHLNGSEHLATRRQFLFSFYELDEPTDAEKNIVNLQDGTIFGGDWAKGQFNECHNVHGVPLGFDKDLEFMKKDYMGQDVVHFTLMGKAEKRKNTAEIIKIWLDEFGGNPKYKLSCLISNPFWREASLISEFQKDITSGRENKLTNIQFLPRLTTNSEVNDFMCSSDVDLTALSGGEGWNLPAFNCACLGSHIVGNTFTAHKDWITENDQRSTFLTDEAFSKVDSEDEIFFFKGSQFNQGNINTISNKGIVADAMRSAAEEVFQQKSKGLKFYQESKEERGLSMQDKFKYRETAQRIIKTLNT